SAIAHVCERPMATWVTPTRPLTFVGRRTANGEPDGLWLPVCPYWLSPQQINLRSAIAQTWLSTARALAFEMPSTVRAMLTGGALGSATDPMSPQHCTAPAVIAQHFAYPQEIAVASFTSAISTGTALSAFLKEPRTDCVFRPQHFTTPAVIAHEACDDVAIAEAPPPRPLTLTGCATSRRWPFPSCP